MHILFLTAEPPWPLDQGDKLRNYYLLRLLASEHQVTLATFVSTCENNKWQQEIGRFCNCIYTVPLSHGQKMLNVLRLPHLPLTMAARASRTMRKLLRELTQEREFDLVFVCQLKMGGFLNCCTVSKKVLELTDVLGIYRSRMGRIVKELPTKLFSLFEECKLTYWETKLAKGSDLISLVSPTDAEVLRKKVDNNVKVLPNGVDIEYFKVLPDSNKPVLIFYGHLRYPPNADGIAWFARDILPFIREYVPEVELLVVGKEPPPEVKELARLPGVTLTGYVPDLRPYLTQASVVVVPLRFGAGVRNKILESLSCGRAVVSTSLGCEGLAVLPGIHLEVADKPHDFAHSVIKLLHDREKREFLSRNGRLVIEDRYSWNAIGKRLNNIINNLL